MFREKVEDGLIFLGLVVMENRLKPQTEGKDSIEQKYSNVFALNSGVLKTLARANIRSIMCTGNLLSGLIDSIESIFRG